MPNIYAAALKTCNGDTSYSRVLARLHPCDYTEGMSQTPSTPNHSLLPGWRRQGAIAGREHELESLNAALHNVVVEGRGGLVFVTGEAGIGKTRLAAELRTQALSSGCRWLEGRYDKEGSIPLKPYAEAVRTYLSTEPEGSLAKLAGPYSTEVAKAFPAIAAGLDPTPQEPYPVVEDTEAARQRYLEAMCHLFFTIGNQQPLLLFLDDFQWAPSMEVLQALAQQALSHPLLLVGAYRDAELREKPILSRSVLDMYRNRLSLTLPLGRLSRDEVSQLMTQALDHTSSERLVDLVFERTEGNPFYVEELVGYLMESGVLTLEGQVWNVRETSGFQMPDTVKLVVEERLERLDQETRRILAMASVIGQEFTLPVLQEVTGVDEEELVDTVDRAVESRVLVPRPRVGQEVYSFADNQVREVLYQDTGTARRRRYHLRVGEAMEKVHTRRPVEQYGVLAHHFLEGNDLEKAADYSIRAGDLAHGQAVFPRAQSHYQIAEELLEELEEESERTAHVHAQLGMNLVTRYAVAIRSEGTQREIEYINRAIDLFVRLGNPRRAAVLHRTLGAAYNVGGGVAQDTQQALHHYQAAVDLMEAEEDSLEKAIAYDGLGVWNLFGGFELDRAEELARKALRIAEAIGDSDAMSQACTTLYLALLAKGLLADGRSYQEEAWAYAQHSRMPVTKERAVAYPIHNSPWMADSDQYRKWFDRWEEVAREVKTRRYDPAVLGTMSAVSALVGQPEASREFLAKLDDMGPLPVIALHGVAQAILGDWEAARRIMVSYNWTGAGASRMRAVGVAPHYGRLLLDIGEPESAEELLRVQRDYCREHGAATFELNLLPFLCQTYLRLGKIEKARVCLTRAQEILSKPEDWKGLAAGVDLSEGHLAAAEERWEDAEPSFQRAVEINQRYGLVYDQARALYQWAGMTLARPAAGERQRGLELLDQSLTLFQRCDAKKDIDRVIALQQQVEAAATTSTDLPDGLTQREVEVLRLVAAGKSNPQIGEELFISPRTVTTHVSNILNKINAANRAEATGYAVREGLA